ncbi:MAG: dethiobiotin synthase [Alphaproteobacteria bacterium]|nr:dethiobiotin synthase [Alphaproteobacteria bacterium]
MSSGLFVSAIGTDCGKTHVSAALLRQLVLGGQTPVALKPLMSGYDPRNLGGSDAGRLLSACGHPITPTTVGDICWKRFEEPSAPNVAARRAGVALDYKQMLQFLKERISTAGPTLVEGAGGVMSPLTDNSTNLDLMSDLQFPVLLVAANYLGAVSHTLTALAVLEQRGLTVPAVVISQPWPHAGPPAIFAEEIARWTSIPVVTAPFSRTAKDDRTWVSGLAARLFG